MANSEETSLESILLGLQEEIRRHNEQLGQIPHLAKASWLGRLADSRWVNTHLPIGWPVMPQGLIHKLEAYLKKIVRRLLRWYINPLFDQQNTFNTTASEALHDLLDRYETLAQQCQVQEAMLERWRSETESSLAEFGVRLQRVENWNRVQVPPKPMVAAVPPEAERAADLDTFVLGARYRNPKQLEAVLGDYDDLFAGLAQAQQAAGQHLPVLDVGCGRGDLVQHLSHQGLTAYGIDANADAVTVATSLGRDVCLASAHQHLHSLDAESLAAIVAIQVIEHLTVDEFVEFLRLAYEKLAPKGFVVLETINPTCVYAVSQWYWLDHGHRELLHPQLARFLLEQAGFVDLRIRLLHPVPDDQRLLPIPEAGVTSMREAIRHINDDLSRLNEFLYGPQDYAVIAYKPEV